MPKKKRSGAPFPQQTHNCVHRLSSDTWQPMRPILPTYSRPVHDTALPVVYPHEAGPKALQYRDSFPSDHGSLLFGLAMLIADIWPDVRANACARAPIVTLRRVHAGLHFLSDVTGCAGLGVTTSASPSFLPSVGSVSS